MRYPLPQFIILFSLLLSLGCTTLIPDTDQSIHATIEFLAVGQGSATLITLDSITVLVDTGPDSSSLYQLLTERNISSLSAVILTHNDRDHFGGLFDILPHITIDHLYLPKNAHSKYHWDSLSTLIQHIRSDTLTRGDLINELTPLSASVLWPTLTHTTPGNSSSTVLHLSLGSHSILLTGDLEEAAERELLALTPDLTVDLLQVAHHGSASSTSLPFISALLPSYAVIPVGKNNPYGHPHQSTLDHLNLYVTDSLYRTDRDSTVVVSLNGQGLSITTHH
ncbi:MAG: MBL fold metallo-hydrolase [Fibrobacterales bacterium]